MKVKKSFATAIAAVTTLSAVSVISMPVSASVAEDDSKVKIMSIGDSITDGYWTSGAYRKYMYNELEKMGYDNIDMVGPKGGNSSTFSRNGETVTYDDNYAGYSGYAIQKMTSKENREGILETIQGTWYNGKNMIAQYNPDIVLLQIGTNDILSEYNDGITDRLENLVNTILQDMDVDDVIYVSTIPDIDAIMRADWLGAYGINAWGSSAEEKQQLMETVQGCIDNYNSSIYELVQKMQGEGKSVKFADINSVVDYKTDLYDGVHPNEQGYENMGKYWAGVLDDYFQNNDVNITPSKPLVTTLATTATTTSTTTTTTTSKLVTTTEAKVTEAPVTTTTTKVTVPEDAKEIHLSDFKIGETYDLSAYKNMDVSAVSFVFSGSMQYGINGCASFGNWSLQKNYNQDDIKDGVLTVALDKDYSDMVVYKWYGEAEISDVILYCGETEEVTTATTTTTAKPTTTTTTTTTAKPTTTTTTTTTAKPTTTTTTTTTAKPTTTTTTTTTAKPTTTTTTTTTAKPITTTTTTTTEPVITTTTTEKSEASNTIVLNDVESGKEYSLAKYNPSAIKEIIIQLDGEVGYGFGGKFVLGNWAVQNDFGQANLKADKTISFEIDNPQDKITIYNYWGNMSIKSVTLVMK